MEIERVDVAHLRKIGGLFQVFAEFVHAEMRVAIGAVVLFGGADRYAGDEVFAFQFVPARAVGKAVSKHGVEILL